MNIFHRLLVIDANVGITFARMKCTWQAILVAEEMSAMMSCSLFLFLTFEAVLVISFPGGKFRTFLRGFAKQDEPEVKSCAGIFHVVFGPIVLLL